MSSIARCARGGSTTSSARRRCASSSRWRSRPRRHAAMRSITCCSPGRSAGILEIELDDDGATTIATRSRGTPRVANRLLKRVRDFAEVRMHGVVTAEAADAALAMLEVDGLGLDRLDREILRAICVKFE